METTALKLSDVKEQCAKWIVESPFVRNQVDLFEEEQEREVFVPSSFIRIGENLTHMNMDQFVDCMLFCGISDDQMDEVIFPHIFKEQQELPSTYVELMSRLSIVNVFYRDFSQNLPVPYAFEWEDCQTSWYLKCDRSIGVFMRHHKPYLHWLSEVGYCLFDECVAAIQTERRDLFQGLVAKSRTVFLEACAYVGDVDLLKEFWWSSEHEKTVQNLQRLMHNAIKNDCLDMFVYFLTKDEFRDMFEQSESIYVDVMCRHDSVQCFTFAQININPSYVMKSSLDNDSIRMVTYLSNYHGYSVNSYSGYLNQFAGNGTLRIVQHPERAVEVVMSLTMHNRLDCLEWVFAEYALAVSAVAMEGLSRCCLSKSNWLSSNVIDFLFEIIPVEHHVEQTLITMFQNMSSSLGMLSMFKRIPLHLQSDLLLPLIKKAIEERSMSSLSVVLKHSAFFDSTAYAFAEQRLGELLECAVYDIYVCRKKPDEMTIIADLKLILVSFKISADSSIRPVRYKGTGLWTALCHYPLAAKFLLDNGFVPYSSFFSMCITGNHLELFRQGVSIAPDVRTIDCIYYDISKKFVRSHHEVLVSALLNNFLMDDSVLTFLLPLQNSITHARSLCEVLLDQRAGSIDSETAFQQAVDKVKPILSKLSLSCVDANIGRLITLMASSTLPVASKCLISSLRASCKAAISRQNKKRKAEQM